MPIGLRIVFIVLSYLRFLCNCFLKVIIIIWFQVFLSSINDYIVSYLKLII